MSYIDDKGKAAELLKRIIESTSQSERHHSEEFARRVIEECSLNPKISAHAPKQYRITASENGLLILDKDKVLEVAYSDPWYYSVMLAGLEEMRLLEFYVNPDDMFIETKEHNIENGFRGETVSAEAKLVFYENGAINGIKPLIKEIGDIIAYESLLRQRGFNGNKEDEQVYYRTQRERNDKLMQKYDQKGFFLALVQITRDSV